MTCRAIRNLDVRRRSGGKGVRRHALHTLFVRTLSYTLDRPYRLTSRTLNDRYFVSAALPPGFLGL